MNRLLLLCVAGLALAGCIARDPPPRPAEEGGLDVLVSGTSFAEAPVVILIFSGPEGFPFDALRASEMALLPMHSGGATGSWTHLPGGDYAVVAILDRDRSGDMTLREGRPTEPYALSRAAEWTAPFEEAAVRVDGATRRVELELRAP